MTSRRAQSDRRVPLVSIICPTYNHDRFLAQCISGVLAQTDARWELIIIDDGSTDSTPSVVAGFDDPRIRYVRQENIGIHRLAETINRALALARGEFVALLSGDDYWPRDKLALQIPAFDDPEVVLSWGHARVVDSEGATIGYMPSKADVPQDSDRSRGVTLISLLQRNYIPACTVVCRRNVLVEIGGFRHAADSPVEDYPTWLEMCKRGLFASSDAELGVYRRHDAQATSTMSEEILLASDWVEEFVRDLSSSELRELGLDAEELGRIASQRRASAEFERGRAALLLGRRSDASHHFGVAFKRGSVSVRSKAVLALVCERTGLDLERILQTEFRIRKGAVSRFRQISGRRHRSA